MSQLRTIQNNFLEGLQNSSSFEKHMKIGGISPKNRFSVYQNNVTQALRKALEITYPLTWKLIGEECANGAAYAFIREENSYPTTGCLDEWGETFPSFLEHFPPTKPLGYLGDVARLEWLKHLSYGSEDAPPLTASDLKDIAPENYPQLIFKFHPSAHLISSEFPLDQILAVIEGSLESLTLEPQKTFGLIIRPHQKVNVHWISPPYFSFMTLIQKKIPLINILEMEKSEDFSLHEFLSFSLQNGLFSDYAFTIT
jgi:hypothetical protein